MPLRKDRDGWTPEEDAWLREQAHLGVPVPKQHQQWPKRFPPRTLSSLRCRRTQLGIRTNPNADLNQSGVPQPKPPEPVQDIKVTDKGDELHVLSVGSEVRTLDELVARAKIDLTKYEVDRPETSMYETSVRDEKGKIRKVQNFRIVARFRLKQGPSTTEQVEALIAGAFAKRKHIVPTLRKTTGNPDIVQAIACADVHIGKLAWPTETGGGPYDTPIAVETFGNGVSYLMREGDEREVGERRFCLLGDYLHHDGRGMTTKGTVLDYDSRIKKLLREGTQLLCDLIAQSAERVPTTVYIVPGNHDFVLTFALQEALYREFQKHPRVTIDDRATSTLFWQWGKCLIGLDHGDKGKKRLADKMTTACEVEWGQTTHREILTGHLHSKAAIDTIGGIVVRTMDSLATADAYHAHEKFDSSPRTIEAFRYHKGGMLAGTDNWSPDLDRSPRKGTV